MIRVSKMRIRALPFVVTLMLVACAARAQYAGGTIFQSLDEPGAQGPGLSFVQVPGNPSLTTGELLAYTQGWTSGARALLSAEAWGAVFGDRDADNVPNDWVNIDAIGLSWFNTAAQPRPWDFKVSFEYNLLNQAGQTLVSFGDVIRITGQNTFQVVISQGSFKAALGTNDDLNVDGFTEMPDGSVLVSFKGTGSASNVINPLSGNPGNLAGGYTGADVFAIRQPFGALAAVLVYRAADLAPVVSSAAVAGSNGGAYGVFTELRDFDLQPNAASVNNPYDPLNVWNSGNRPHLVFHAHRDENVLCTSAAASPTGSVYWARVEGGTGVGGFSTNLPSQQVAMDALAIAPNTLPAGSAITVDIGGTGFNPATSIVPPGGSLTFGVRNLSGGANKVAGVVIGATLNGGTGSFVGTGGFNNLIVSPFDTLLLASLQPPFSTVLTTGNSDAFGTALTSSLPIPPNTAPMTLYVQAIQLGPIFPLSAPNAVRIQ